MNKEKKNCMVQVALQKQTIFGFASDHDVVEDTGLITWDEAVDMWEKYKPKVAAQIKEGQNPEMCIWVNCKDTTDYHTSVAHIQGHQCEVEGDKIYVLKKEEIKPLEQYLCQSYAKGGTIEDCTCGRCSL